MKKTIHIVNSIISAAIIVLGVALIVTESKNITNDIMGTISGGVAATMGLCIMVVGVFFPKDPTEVSDTGKKVLSVAVVLNSLLNKKVPNSAAVNVANGKTKIHRGWEPTAILIWAVFQAIIGIFVIVEGSEKGRWLSIGILLLIALLFSCSIVWRLLDQKEKTGRFNIPAIVLPLVIVVGIFTASGFLGTLATKAEFSEWDNVKPTINEGSHISTEAESYDEKQLLDKVSEEFDGQQLYYKIQHTEKRTNLIVWTDTDKQVYIYLLEKVGEGKYRIFSSIISQSVTYEDVQGKEDGIIFEKADN